MTLRAVSKAETLRRNKEIINLLLKSRIPLKVVAQRFNLSPNNVYVILHRFRAIVERKCKN